MTNRLAANIVERRLEAWRDCNYSANEAAKLLKINRRVMDRFLDRYAPDHKHDGAPMIGALTQTQIRALPLPKRGAKRYLLTCAQNNTAVHAGFWRNLTAFADHIDAELLVSRFTYNKQAYAGPRKPSDVIETNHLSWATEVVPHLSDDPLRLAPGLVWCGNLQILPTAERPLSGYESYTGPASSIIPHTKIAMQPVATPRSLPAKHLYTTGACTLKNYIQAKAGQKAEFHHSFGALLVEVLPGGDWFARQLVANNRGTFCDFPYRVVSGEVTETAQVAAIQWGDINLANIDPNIRRMFWREGGVLDTLRPKHQIFHDLVDGESHNHHNRHDHHERFRLHQEGRANIGEEFAEARSFLDKETYRDWCKSLIVWSNHDEFLRKYLQQNDYRNDPENALFIVELESVNLRAIAEGKEPPLFEAALNSERAKVLTDDGNPVLIEGIQVDYHGHVGASGSRGSVQQYAKLGLKTMTGHSHAAWWFNGATSAGTCSKLDLGYNKGPGSWSHTFTILYVGGKRQQITANAAIGKWRAGYKR